MEPAGQQPKEPTQLPSPNSQSGAARVWAVIKKSGSFLIGQSRTLSENWAEHRGRMATADALASVLVEEAKAATRVKEDLLKQLAGADPTRAAEIRLVLRETDAHIRSVAVFTQSQLELGQLPKPASERVDDELNDHWFDKFLDLARAKNEPWRAQLLAKALAQEASKPSSISLETLWRIGMMTESLFYGFSHIVDLCIFTPYGVHFLPTTEFTNEDVPDCRVPKCSNYGHLMFLMEDAGLFHFGDGGDASYFGGAQNLQIVGEKEFRYASHVVLVKPPAERGGCNLPGFCATRVGSELAQLYDQKEIPLGLEYFRASLGLLRYLGCILIAQGNQTILDDLPKFVVTGRKQKSNKGLKGKRR